jgi:hypothetical protein
MTLIKNIIGLKNKKIYDILKYGGQQFLYKHD